VEKYFSQGLGIPSTSFFNKTGRAFPDLATMGVGFQVFVGGHRISVGGTSASTPTFAAMVSMMNTLRFNAGLPSMGFIHPFLYQIWENNVGAYRDITMNHNQLHGCCNANFQAVVGWEPVCGLGVPDFSVMSNLALSDSVFPYLFA
jgi:tripeptidyl-peptidase I